MDTPACLPSLALISHMTSLLPLSSLSSARGHSVMLMDLIVVTGPEVQLQIEGMQMETLGKPLRTAPYTLSMGKETS